MEPVRASDDLWKPRMRGNAKTPDSIDAEPSHWCGEFEVPAAVAALEPRDLKLALLGDALERFTRALDAILIIGAV